MTLDFELDIDDIMEECELAVDYTFNGVVYQGIFNRRYKEHQIGNTYTEGTEPELITKASNTTEMSVGSDIEVEGSAYVVSRPVEDNGKGLARVALRAI